MRFRWHGCLDAVTSHLRLPSFICGTTSPLHVFHGGRDRALHCDCRSRGGFGAVQRCRHWTDRSKGALWMRLVAGVMAVREGMYYLYTAF